MIQETAPERRLSASVLVRVVAMGLLAFWLTAGPDHMTPGQAFEKGTTTTTAGSPPPPPSGNVLKRWAATNGGGSSAQTHTQQDAVNDARNYTWIVALQQTFTPTDLAAMRAANPSVKVLAYLNGAYAQANQGPGSGAYDTPGETLYARDINGNYITSWSFGNWLMDISNSGWVQTRTSTCATYIANSGYDGCYLDVLGIASLDPNYVTSPPVNPQTRQLWTAPDWEATAATLGGAVKNGNAGRIITGNGLANGTQYFDPASGPTSRLIGPLDGANSQGYVRNENADITAYKSVTRWKQDVDMLVDAGARGKSVLAMVRIGVLATTAQVQSWRRYALATFLLGTDGRAFFFFDPDGIDGAVAYDHPDLHVVVGTPTGGYSALANGAYIRKFTTGAAVVNPTGVTVTVSLGGTYKDLDGNVMSSVTLGPNTGMVFTTTTSPPPTTTTPTGSTSSTTRPPSTTTTFHK